MPSLSDSDNLNLIAILDTIRKIELFTMGIENADEFYSQEMIFDATLMNFVVLGELVDKLSDQTRTQFPHIHWPRIKSLRNIIAHQYFGVDAEELWQIIQRSVPAFKEQVQQIMTHHT